MGGGHGVGLTVPIEHHTVIIAGGGPAGLPLAVVLGGWHPYFRGSRIFSQRYPQLEPFLARHDGTLLCMDMRDLVHMGVPPLDLFRILHHPRQKFEELEQVAMAFEDGPDLDYLLLSREAVGGLWNNVPRNLLTLSPGQWMEFAFYPLAQHIAEQGIEMDVNALIIKHRLIEYYHRVPVRFEQQERIRTGENVERIEPHTKGFLLHSRDVSNGVKRRYTCKYLVLATGQRAILRRLGVPGDDQDWVISHYDTPEDLSGERVLVVGGGRSADWAATELHDAGKQVYYAMRQGPEVHWRLINDSRLGLPYYSRIAAILEAPSKRLETLYDTHIREIGSDHRVRLEQGGEERVLEVEHVITEIGGVADYSILKGFPPLQLEEKYDAYRFQVHQAKTHPYNYESIDIPNLYLGGYLAAGIGLVVIAMHGTTYAIAGDILQRERKV